jgi:hypothetical protein
VGARFIPAAKRSSPRAGWRANCAWHLDTARRLSGKAFFLDPEANPQLPVVGRMWSVRDLSLAAGMSAATGTNIAQ